MRVLWLWMLLDLRQWMLSGFDYLMIGKDRIAVLRILKRFAMMPVIGLG